VNDADRAKTGIHDPACLTAAEAVAAMARGELSSEELTRACLDRIAERDAIVRAWAFVDRDRALRQARERDREPSRGPLHGLPVGVKDMIDTVDMPTQHNSPIRLGHQPRQDAACVSILRSAGAVILGKTETHEFAAGGRLPLSRNPHDPAHTAGGSSSGSAAAVADDHVPLALGTQTAGSTIRPASFCGADALKPTWSTVNREGAKMYSPSLDTIGWFGKSVADLGLLHDVFAVGRVPWISRARVRGLKIGVCRTPFWDQAGESSRRAIEETAATLAGAGATVADLVLPEEFRRLNADQAVVMRGEGRAAFLAEYRSHHHLLHQDFRDRVEDSDKITPARLLEALDFAAACRPRFDELAAGYDAILTPAAVDEAPRSLKTTGDPLFNRMWTLLHAPCVTLRGHLGSHGLPVGIQLVGARFGDGALLGAASAVETVLPAQHRMR
jgi:Asp-tRNA(Asn)/Glu-tRNA(Gln) amidotransferase A subunit family amidase